MDYFIIIITMMTLFFGLLFFVDDFPTGTKEPAEYLAFFIMIFSTIVVVIMILWDANTRRVRSNEKLNPKKNDKKKLKMKLKRKLAFEEHEDDTRLLLVQLHEIDEKEDLFHVKELPWDVDFQFKFLEFQTDSETPEENFKSMNDIFENLFSFERLKRKFYLIKRKGGKTTSKIIKKLKKKSKEEKLEEKDIEMVIKESKRESKSDQTRKSLSKKEMVKIQTDGNQIPSSFTVVKKNK
jgi:hypothetical protein